MKMKHTVTRVQIAQNDRYKPVNNKMLNECKYFIRKWLKIEKISYKWQHYSYKSPYKHNEIIILTINFGWSYIKIKF